MYVCPLLYVCPITSYRGKFPAGAEGGGGGAGFWGREMEGFLGVEFFNFWDFFGGFILLGNFLLIQQSEVVIP